LKFFISEVFLLFHRFFGRFALDDAIHDEQTLKAIRDNAGGLRGIRKLQFMLILTSYFYIGIAGERLWMELQRMAEGRNAGSVLKVMLEQDIGQYLGRIKSPFIL
jgi:tRNA nucleotidyltransferase/poly(A) polymerase